jgi:hypothetical protein
VVVLVVLLLLGAGCCCCFGAGAGHDQLMAILRTACGPVGCSRGAAGSCRAIMSPD